MARLLVYRGETLDRELELVRLPFRIGRAATNDLVLEDPGKSVSREHAEIRLEGGRFVLVDRQSENGIWVAGARQPLVQLDRDVVASIGPFRLKVEGAPSVVAPQDDAATIARNIDSVLPPPLPIPAPLPRATPLPTPGTGVGSDDIIGGLVSSPSAGDTALPTAVPPRAKTPPPQVPPAKPRAGATKPRSQPVWVAGAGAAVIAIILIAVVVLIVRTMRGGEPAVPDVSSYIANATQQIAQGACADALSQTIAPGLEIDPNSAPLQALKQSAEACVAAAAAVPSDIVPPDVAAARMLTDARDLITKNSCAEALSQINFVLLTFPTNADALALKTEAEKCAPPAAAESATVETQRPQPPPTRPSAPTVQRVPSESGGLDVLPGEKEADYRARLDAMKSRYDAAVASAARTPNRTTIAALEAISRDAGPRYLEIAAKIAEAKRANATQLLNDGREAANRQQWKQAIERFNQALEIDPRLAGEVETLTANARQEMQTAGRAACTRARQLMNYDQAAAPAQYRIVIETLPEDDACYVEARRILGR